MIRRKRLSHFVIGIDPGARPSKADRRHGGVGPSPGARRPGPWKTLTATLLASSSIFAAQVANAGAGAAGPSKASPTVAIASPGAGTTVSGIIPLTGTASPSRKISKVQVQVDSAQPLAATGTSKWSVSLDTTAFANGSHVLRATAWDSAGNSATTVESVLVNNGPAPDTTPPSVTITQPQGGAAVSGIIEVSGTASDDNGVAKVEVSMDGGTLKTASGTTSWSTSIDTSAYVDANHTITARAVDLAGNASTTSRVVTVANGPPPDTTPPTVVMTAPAAGGTVSGSVGVQGTATDNAGLGMVDVSIDGGAFRAATGTASWSYGFDTSTVADGAHTVTARATDTSGNTGTATITLTVSNAAGSNSHMVTAEGVTIDVSSAGPWTAPQIYDLLKPSALQLSLIGPHLTIEVQDTYSSQTTTSASSSGGVYTSFTATIYLKGVNSTFSVRPESQIAHEYGHAWTLYHLYMTQNGDWSSYLNYRWANADGSVRLGGDPRLDTTYTWNRFEIIAEDYRLLFGSSLAVSESPLHMNTDIPQPSSVTGLRSFLLNTWGA
ncbi:MAG: Ig-like domain-containing protein [Actinomycetota bacterium]